MTNIKINEFIPPIVHRIIKFVNRIIVDNFNTHTGLIIPPFDAIPLTSAEVKLILDIGANHGAVALSALRTYPNARLICFEPVKNTFSSLKINLNSYSERVTLNNVALSNETGELNINLMSYDGANSLDKQSNYHKSYNPHVTKIGEEVISVQTLDEVQTQFNSDEVDIVKIDVEGFEMKVLEGGGEFFKNCVRFVLIEIAFMRDKSTKNQEVFNIFSFFHQSGFALINVIDIHYAPQDSKDLRIAQMDCVFMNNKFNK
jgi:FkbM family methyltransferase